MRFGDKLNYSGFDRDQWPLRTHAMHMQHVSEVQAALTATRQSELERLHGVRYSELLRLPYLDIIKHHVVDPMHNFLLGTGKHVMTVWREQGILSDAQFELIQGKVDRMRVPSKIGRIPQNIFKLCILYCKPVEKLDMCVFSLLSAWCTLTGAFLMLGFVC